MKRRGNVLLAAVVLSSIGASPAYAQTREWDDTCQCYITCVGCSDPDETPTPERRSEDAPTYVSPPDPAAERLKAYLQSFDSASLVFLEEASAALEPWRGLPKPTSEAQLSRRLDEMLAAVWPQLRSTTLQVELLRRQLAFYNGQNIPLRGETARMTGYVARLQEEVFTQSREVAEAETNLAVAQRLESELQELALAVIYDRASERRAGAIITAFSPRPNLPADRGPGGVQYAMPVMPAPALRPAAQASRGWTGPPTNYADFSEKPPYSGSPIEEKLVVMRNMGSRLQRNFFDGRDLRWRVAAGEAENASLRAQFSALESQEQALRFEKSALVDRLANASADTDAAIANQRITSDRIVTEVVTDIALDTLSDRMNRIVEKIAVSEGADMRFRSNERDALLEYVRQGGKLALPSRRYAAQWNTFMDVQEKTLDLLDRAEGFMLEAVQVLGRGSPAEIEKVLERVFGSVRWQTFELISTAASGMLPESEGAGVKDTFASYLGKLRQRQAGPES